MRPVTAHAVNNCNLLRIGKISEWIFTVLLVLPTVGSVVHLRDLAWACVWNTLVLLFVWFKRVTSVKKHVLCLSLLCISFLSTHFK